jgi:hypothetical protein
MRDRSDDAVYAWVAAATHVLASLAMVLLLRRGLPGFPQEERLAYIAAHRAAWTIGWLLWQVAAVSLISFYLALALRFRGVLSWTAVAVAAAGISIDIVCESRYLGILPELSGAEFARLDRELEVLIGYAANGLYTVALLFLVAAGWKVLPVSARLLAVPVLLSGFALAVASLQHSARLETLFSAILFPTFIVWIIIVGLWMRRSGSSSPEQVESSGATSLPR